jgi:formamidopyrimidine-DNA glycosylase
LPEVETVRRSLIPYVVGRRIVGIRLTDFPGVLGDNEPSMVAELLRNRTVVDIRRRAKYLVLGLDDDTALIVHLRMTGTLTITDRVTATLRFERLAIELDDGSELRFADQRKFGRVLHATPEQWAQTESRIGPEPLAPDFMSDSLRARLLRRTAPLKSILLNQQVIAGLGNIYVDEALFHAKLHPLRNPSTLSEAEIRRLHRAIRTVLKGAIVNRGTTFSSYRDGAGMVGNNQQSLKVYGRGGRGNVCYRCGSPIERLLISGRSSHFCPRCQPVLPDK